MKNKQSVFWVFLFLLILVFLPAVSFADSRLSLPDIPLLEAVKKGDRTPLPEASGRGQVEVVQDLIAKGADMNAKGMEWKESASKQKTEFIKVVETREEWTDLWRRSLQITIVPKRSMGRKHCTVSP